jgi:hypothetical protein
MKRVALLDVDGTLCPSIFANITHNDNSRFDDVFLEKLRNVEPYPWVGEWDWEQYHAPCIIVTGRLSDWNKLTWRWLDRWTRIGYLWDYTENIHWDDSLPTREESYKKYVQQKTLKLLELIARYNYAGYHVDVFEDDGNVIARLNFLNQDVFDITRYIVEGGKIRAVSLLLHYTEGDD